MSAWVVRVMQAGPTRDGRRITQTSLRTLLPLLPWVPIVLHPADGGGLGHLPDADVRARRVVEASIVGHIAEPQLLREGIYARGVLYDDRTPLAAFLRRVWARSSPRQREEGFADGIVGLSAMTFVRENDDRERLFTSVTSVDVVTVPLAGGAFITQIQPSTGEMR